MYLAWRRPEEGVVNPTDLFLLVLYLSSLNIVVAL